MNAAQSAALDYVRAGFVLVPIQGRSKGPRDAGWGQLENCVRDESQVSKIKANLGLVHFHSRTCVIDIDDYVRAQDWLSERGVDIESLLTADDAVQIRSNRENRAKLLYRLPEGLDPLSTVQLAKENGSPAIELRCAARGDSPQVQDVLPPSIHPDTGKPYEWGGDGHYSRPPFLPSELLGLWQGELEQPRKKATNATASDDGFIAEGGRDAKLTRIAGSLRRQGLGADSIASALRSVNDSACRPPLPVGQVQKIAQSVSRYPPAGESEQEQPEPLDLADASVAHMLNTAAPERAWIADQRLAKGIVGMLTAQGATGKSTLVLQLAVSVASGSDWVGFPIMSSGPVLIFSSEDDHDEIHRRLEAIMKHYEGASHLRPDMLRRMVAKNLFVFDRVGKENIITREANGNIERTPFLAEITRVALSIPNLALIVLDPLSRFDGGKPNDSSHSTRFIEAAESLRKATGATVLIPHHTNKASAGELEPGQNASRGSGGYVDSARWNGVLVTLPKDQAKEWGVHPDEAGYYIRFTTPKVNGSAPWPGMWLKRGPGGVLEAVELQHKAKETAIQKRGEERYEEVVQKVVELVRQKQIEGTPLTKNKLKDYAGSAGMFGVGDQLLRGIVARAIEEKKIREHRPDPKKSLVELHTW